VFKRLTGVLKAFEQLFRPTQGEPPAPKAPSDAPPQAPSQASSQAPPRTPSPAAADFLAWSQAQAKQSDDARKARIRAHVERTAPPTGEADRRTLELAQGTCLAVRHVYPPEHPQRSFSFLGGLPLAPDDFDYPMIHNRAGLLEPLTFMAQIDLGALPEGAARSLLPAQGYLYFFAPMSGGFDATANHFVVRFVPGKATKRWGPQWTGILQPVGGAEARYRFPWLNWYDQPEKVYPTSYPRTEITLGWIDDGGEVADGDPDGANGFPWEVAEQRRRARLLEFHGAPVTYDPVLSPAGKPTDRLWIPFDGFPTNRRAAAVVLGFLKSRLKEEREAIAAAVPAGDAAERERLAALLEEYRRFEQRHWRAWSHAAGETDRGKPLGEDAKATILQLLEEVRAGGLPRPFVERRRDRDRLPYALNQWLSVAAVESVESALQDPAHAGLIPPAIVTANRYRHTVLRDPGYGDREVLQHQMLGRGRVIQTAADEMARDHVLLLQLSPDEVLGWDLGDNGAMQYWIRPADLAAQRFEHSVLTFESH
jgi:hypothetical protein